MRSDVFKWAKDGCRRGGGAMALLDHPKNVRDESGEKGFQWTFDCDVCGSGFTTAFIPSKSQSKAKKLGFLGRGASVLSGMTGSSALGGLGGAAQAAEHFQNMSADWHKEHDGAFSQAVNEARIHFKKCPRCKRYVCEEDWNDEAGLCTQDAPSFTAEFQAAQASTKVEQMQAHMKTQTLYGGEMEQLATVCPTCGKSSGSGKFCQNCGAALGYRECQNCHHRNPPTVNFCGECGQKL